MAELVSTPSEAIERAERYRNIARETLRLAEAATRPEVKSSYLSISACWTSLAREAESASRRDFQVPVDGDEISGGIP